MTSRLFECSACGAPLVPKGSTSVINCPYCHASVVVPEELRQVSGAATWSTQVFDSFAANDNNWLVGNQSDKYFAKLSQTITEGRYRWEGQATNLLNSTISTAWLMGYRVSDLHLIVNCKHISGSRAGSSWGAIFRVQDNQNYYLFHITDHQFFGVSMIKDGQWLTLVDWAKTDAIKPTGVNQVEVIAYATHFTFLINGRVVSEVDDDHFAQGLIGLSIEAYTHSEKIAFDFLDITLRAP